MKTSRLKNAINIPLLAAGCFIWNITLSIGENLIALTGIFIFTLPIVIVTIQAVLRINRYRAEELREHLTDYPWSPMNKHK